MQTPTITIPKKLIKNLVESNIKAQEAAEKLEDFLLMQNPEIIKQVEGSMKAFAKGKKIPFSKL